MQIKFQVFIVQQLKSIQNMGSAQCEGRFAINNSS